MKRRRVLVLLTSAAGLLALALLAPPRPPRGFATPAECLDAYRDACKDGDAAGHLRCLAEPLRSQEQATRPEELTGRMDGVLSWGRGEPVIDGAKAYVDVDRVKASGTQRIRFHLERSGGGWLIVRIDRPSDVPTPIRPGTPVGDVP
jgi:hypothetical protein